MASSFPNAGSLGITHLEDRREGTLASLPSRVVDALDPVSQAWHNMRHEGFLDVGPLRIASHRFITQQEKAAFSLGREAGRIDMCGAPAPEPPARRHLRVVV